MIPDQIAQMYLFALLQLALVYLLISASWRLSGWLWPEPDWGQRLMAAGLLFCTIPVVMIASLGVLGILHPLPVAGLTIALWAFARWSVQVPAALPKLDLPREMYWPLFLAGLVAVPFAVRSIFVVELGWDSITYHLYFPAVWIQEGRVFLVDGVYPYNYLAFYPKHYELIQTYLMIVARNDIFTKFITLPFLGLSAMVAGMICFRLGGSRLASWCAGLFALTVPAMFCWAAVTYVEPLLNFFLLSAIYFIVRAWEAEPKQLWRCGILGGLAVGLAAGSKYTALYEVAFLCLVLLLFPVVRRLSWRAVAPFAVSFAGAALITGIWWLAMNALVTGNPVYPVAAGSLPAVVDKERPGIHESSIWNDFEKLRSEGVLWKLWFGDLPPTEGLLAVGADMANPAHLSLGIKFLVLLPLILMGLGYCLVRMLLFLWRRDLGAAAAVATVAGSALVLLYTYLKVPYWGDVLGLFSQIRFGMPFILLAWAMGFAYLARLFPARVLVGLVLVGLIVDALVLDLRFPELDRISSFALLLGLGGFVYWLWKRGVERTGTTGLESLEDVPGGSGPEPATFSPVYARSVFRLAVLVLVVLPFPLMTFREKNRYLQWASYYEVHVSMHNNFAQAACLLEQKYPGVPTAYAGEFVSFLYLFVGPQLDRRLCYVPTCGGPMATYLKEGELRDVFDRDAWTRNLKSSGVKLLLTMRIGDRQKPSSSCHPVECQWAEELAFPLVYKDERDRCRVYEVIFPETYYLSQTR